MLNEEEEDDEATEVVWAAKDLTASIIYNIIYFCPFLNFESEHRMEHKFIGWTLTSKLLLQNAKGL